jgi:beta-glucanase (GH16 family)
MENSLPICSLILLGGASAGGQRATIAWNGLEEFHLTVSHIDVSALALTATRRRLRHSSATVFLFALMLVAATAWPITPTYAQSDQPGAVASQALTGWKLTWSDEFNGRGEADPTKWVNEVGGQGWGNQELEYYTAGSTNAVQSGGNLVISARDNGASYSCWYGPCRYTSARLTTKGLFSQQYGRFVARMKLPSGAGLWPAFWMLGDNIDTVGWPKCGEIDVMEEWGNAPTSVRGTLHGPLPGGGSYDLGKFFQLGPDLFADYHEYAIEWAPNSVKFFIDDIEYTSYGPGDLSGGGRWVFNDQPFHIVVNLALIGNVTAVFPQSLLIDWIRVYSPVRPQPTTR